MYSFGTPGTGNCDTTCCSTTATSDSTSDPAVKIGVGSPEGVVTATTTSAYTAIYVDRSTGEQWVKLTVGTGNTGWAKMIAA